MKGTQGILILLLWTVHTALWAQDITWPGSFGNTRGTEAEAPTYSCPEIPDSMEFCGLHIDLTRFDRRERMDRELLAFTYMHSTSIGMLKRANRYFPLIEPILKENSVPDDFKYLMVIESNLNPTALSGSGAAGLWQLMAGTARDFGLEVDHTVDERYDVEKSTRAACRYLKQAYKRFGNWETVAASYNGGQARISSQLDKQYVDNALDLQLVEETTRYIYRILAAKVMFSDPKKFGFRLRASDLYPPIPYRTLQVDSTIEDLPRFAKGQGINYSLLRSMNPWLRSHTLPNHGKKVYILHLPDKEGMYYNPRVVVPHNHAWVIDERNK